MTLLPSKEKIFATDDVQELIGMRDMVEVAQKRIQVDLEYSNFSEDWAKRARGALAAHDCTHANIQRRIAQLTKKPSDNAELQIKAKEAKALKKQANAVTQLAQLEQSKNATEAKKIILHNRILDMVQQTSFFARFYKLARKTIDRKTFEEIEAAVHAEIEAKIQSLGEI